MQPPRRSVRVVLALGIALGVVDLVALPTLLPDQLGLASAVYATAAEAALAGGSIYGVAPPGLAGYTFLYPPVVVLAFLPFGLLGPIAAFLAVTALSVAAGLAVARLVAADGRRAGVEVARLDRALLAGFCVLSIHAAPTLVNGQLNLLLGALLAVGFVALERDRSRPAGVAFGLAATVKLVPAVVGAYLLRRRAWRAIGAATATGVALLALGLLAFGPETTATYVGTVVPGEVKTGALSADPLAHDYLTVRRQLAFLGAAPAWIPALAVLVVAPVVGATYLRLATRVDRLLAFLATLVGTLLVLPLEGLYFPLVSFPLLSLLLAVPPGRVRALLLAGTLLTLVQVVPTALAVVDPSAVLGPGLGEPVEAATASLFRVVLPPTVGMWLLLAAGICNQLRPADGAASDGVASPTDRSARPR